MKIKLSVLLLPLVLLSGCSDDDSSAGSYIGTWIATNIEVTNCDNAADESRSVNCSDVDCYRIIFDAAGTYSFQTGLGTERGDWSSSGTTITLCIEEDGEPICTTAIGIVSSETLRLTFTSETDGCETTYIMQRFEEPELADDGQ